MKTFYEVPLSDNDGSNATAHIWSDGKWTMAEGTKAVFRRLARICQPSVYDAEMPDFARKVLAKMEGNA